MNFDSQWIDRVLVISLVLIISNSICHGWHQTLTFRQRLSYELSKLINAINDNEQMI